jgi:hypothetical protein
MIFSVTGEQFNLGSHFLIWSVHYLSSQKTYYRQQDQSTRTIPENPLTDGTAHRFFMNHCRSEESYQKTFEFLSNRTGLYHLKYTPRKKTLEESNKDIAKFHVFMADKNIKVLNTTCDDLQHLIAFLRFDYQIANWQHDMNKVKEHCRHYWPDFFKDQEIYLDNLNSWHDIREGIAFNLRPNDLKRSVPNRIVHENILHHRFEDFLQDGKNTIKKVLNFLNLSYNDSVIDNWCDTHAQWSNYLKHYIYFCNDINVILSNIVLDRPMDLTKYKMDVLKEGVLLHFLMFKHDLNIKIKTEVLPKNTKEILELLGKNQRTGLAKLYDRE